MQTWLTITLSTLFSIISGLCNQQGESPHIYKIVATDCSNGRERIIQTGFRVTEPAGIITALHGVVHCRSIYAVPSYSAATEQSSALGIERVDIARDMALLLPTVRQTEASSSFGLEPTENFNEGDGENVCVIGHPLGIPTQLTSRMIRLRPNTRKELWQIIPPDQALVAALKERKSPDLSLQVLSLEAELIYGHSGAPMINQMGQVVGIVNGGLAGEGADSISWAIPWGDIVWENIEVVSEKLELLETTNPQLVFAFEPSALSQSMFIEYTGHVVNADTAEPIAGVEVTLAFADQYYVTYTDSRGFYLFKLQLNSNLEQVLGKIEVNSNGYKRDDRYVRIDLQKSNPPEEFRLFAFTADERCNYTFTVYDTETQQKTQGAIVRLAVGSSSYREQTDINGNTSFQVACPTHDVQVNLHVEAKGYVIYTEDIKLSEDATKEIGLTSLTLLKPAQTPTLEPPGQCRYVILTLDKNTEAAIGRAEIRITTESQTIFGMTDTQGIYIGDLPCRDMAISVIRVEAEGYETYTERMTGSQVSSLKEIFLTQTIPNTSATNRCSYAFTVYDLETQAKIQGASVRLTVGADTYREQTDTYGDVKFELPCADNEMAAKVEVSGLKYKTHAENLKLLRNNTEEIGLVLLIESPTITPTPISTPIPVVIVAPSHTPTELPIRTITPTLAPTSTNTPTFTPTETLRPTDTPEPTETPVPPTPTRLRGRFVYEGTVNNETTRGQTLYQLDVIAEAIDENNVVFKGTGTHAILINGVTYFSIRQVEGAAKNGLLVFYETEFVRYDQLPIGYGWCLAEYSARSVNLITGNYINGNWSSSQCGVSGRFTLKLLQVTME